MLGLTLVLFLIVLACTAPLFGADSTDGIDSPEWERRRTWRRN